MTFYALCNITTLYEMKKSRDNFTGRKVPLVYTKYNLKQNKNTPERSEVPICGAGKRNICTLYMDHALDYNGGAVESFRQEGGESMITISDFLLSVAASVAGYYICKWLDGRH